MYAGKRWNDRTPKVAGTERTSPSCAGASKTSRVMSKLALRARTARRSTMRVAAYVRVSTSRQVKLETIEQQLEMVRRHAQEQGWELSEEGIFRDDGYSGTTLGRPALDALRDKTRLREFQVVVVPSPDRLARNYVHQMVLIEEFEKGGCLTWSSWRGR